ncbi:MAG: hypothetical protein IJO49_04355, partial [Clostridia bacterium]|nr:hypothetical protein [Clostridia bacterium]
STKTEEDKGDATISFTHSEVRYNNLLEAGSVNVTFIELEGYGHNAWEYVDSDAEGIKWLFEQNLKNR